MDPATLAILAVAAAAYFYTQSQRAASNGYLPSSRIPGAHTAVPVTNDPIALSQTNPYNIGGGGGGGLLAGAGALLTNPITAAALAAGVTLTWGVTVKGWFRGGEEGVRVNPARDQYLLEFGPPGTASPLERPGGSGFMNLAIVLSSVTGQPDGSQFHIAMQRADTMSKFETAVRDIDAVLVGAGITNRQQFDAYLARAIGA